MFEESFKSADVATKLEFLEALLNRNSGFKEQFVAFYRDRLNVQTGFFEDPEDFIDKNSKSWQEKLEALDFDEPDWENYVPRHSGYIPDYEAMEHLAEDMIEEVMKEYEDELLGYTNTGYPVEAFLLAIAGLDAVLHATLKDEYDTLGDGNFYLVETLREKFNKLRKSLSLMVISGNQLEHMGRTLFNHFHKLDDAPDDYLRFFEPILLILTERSHEAAILRKLMQECNIKLELLPRLAVKLRKLGKDPEGWEQTARQLYMMDQQVADELLQYDLKNNQEQFVATAKKIWRKEEYRYVFGDYLFDHLRPYDSDGLYKQ